MSVSQDAKKVSTDLEVKYDKVADRNDLNEDERKRLLAPLGFVGTVTGNVRFELDNSFGGIATKHLSIFAPEGTLRVSTCLGDWDFSFGPRTHYLERPLSHILIRWRITNFGIRQIDIDVNAFLRDVNADDPWEANVEIIALCYA